MFGEISFVLFCIYETLYFVFYKEDFIYLTLKKMI